MTFGERFLRHPELFPARRGGEPWGPCEITLALPGGPFLLGGLNEAQADALREQFGGFFASGEGMRVDVMRVAAGEFGGTWTKGEYTLDMRYGADGLCLAGMNLLALVDWAPPAAALWVPLEGGRVFAAICENFLRALVAHRLLRRGGLLLHASAATRGGETVVFVGRSGAGKTTIAKLLKAEGADVVSDDIVAVAPDGGGFSVLPSPFGTDFRGTPGPARRLGALVSLRKGTEHAARPQAPAAAVAAVVACAPYVNRDPHRTEDVIAAGARLAQAVPVKVVLTFAPRDGIWNALHGTVAA